MVLEIFSIIALIVIMLTAVACIKSINNTNNDLIVQKMGEIYLRLKNTPEEVNVDFITLTDTAKMPTQEHEGDLYDVYADEDMLITSKESELVSTGIAFSIPKGYQLRLYNRSGGPLKCKLVLSNGTGVIDTQYTGEIKGQFFTIDGTYQIKKGDKIMQLELVKIIKINFRRVKELPKTDRGAGGFGSTGK